MLWVRITKVGQKSLVKWTSELLLETYTLRKKLIPTLHLYNILNYFRHNRCSVSALEIKGRFYLCYDSVMYIPYLRSI